MLPSYRHGQLLLGYRWGRARAGHVAVLRLERPTLKRLIRHEAAGWWIEGDNAIASTDSRHFGAVAAGTIEAIIIWPHRPVLH